LETDDGRCLAQSLQLVADLSQQFQLRINLFLWLFLAGSAASSKTLIELVHWQYQCEVDCSSDQQEVDQSGEEDTELDVYAFNGQYQEAVEVWRTNQRSDQWHQHIVNKGSDNGAEGSTDDDSNGQIDNVALHNKIAETF